METRPQQVASSGSGPLREDDVVDIDEDAVLTSAVFGSSFVHAVKIQDMAGETVILFVFSVSQAMKYFFLWHLLSLYSIQDLSVKIEGQ